MSSLVKSIKHSDEKGFSYVDVLIGVTILLVGVLALAAAVTAAVVRTREGEQRLIAKQLATSTLESIFSARDIGTLGWDSIGNVGNNVVNGVPRGIFLIGRQQIFSDPGPDRVVGTSDDGGTPLQGFQRQITISDYDDPERPRANGFPIMMRRIDVTIFYYVGGIQRQETVSTMISNYAIQ